MSAMRLNILTGKMEVPRPRPAAVRSSPLTRDQLAHLREAAATQRAQADSLLGLLDHADQATADAATARAEAERLRKEIESHPPVTAAPAAQTSVPLLDLPADGTPAKMMFARRDDGLLRSITYADAIRFDVVRDELSRAIGLNVTRLK